jgi:hypothetical protein
LPSHGSYAAVAAAAAGGGSNIFVSSYKQVFTQDLAPRYNRLLSHSACSPFTILPVNSTKKQTQYNDHRAQGVPGGWSSQFSRHFAIEPATFRLVAQYLNQLRHRMPPSRHISLNLINVMVAPLHMFRSTDWLHSVSSK